MLRKYDETSINLNQNDTAVTPNQSLPSDPSILSLKDSLISKPHGKRVAISRCFFFTDFFFLKCEKFNSSVLFLKITSR